MVSKNKVVESKRAGTSLLQCICALTGFAVTLSAIAVLAHSAFSTPLPAALSIAVETLRPSADGWVAEVVVTNTGDQTATAVDIEGEVGSQKAGASLDYVPGRGEKKASLVFSGKQRPNPRLRVLGWSAP